MFKVFFTVLLAIHTIAEANGLSAKRYENESYEEAKVRVTFELGLFHPQLEKSQPFYNANLSAERQKQSLSNLSFESVTEVSREELNRLFTYLRDTPFLESVPFNRRATWLYPDDGCYARAALMSLHYTEVTQAEPSKIFAFGDLRVQTPNSLDGFVTWWYHVAIAYRVENQVYVLDPSVDPTGPLLLKEWSRRISPQPQSTKFSLCTKDAYDPDSNCFAQNQSNPSRTYYEQRFFLSPEWDRLLELGRSPEHELGSFPPWQN